MGLFKTDDKESEQEKNQNTNYQVITNDYQAFLCNIGNNLCFKYCLLSGLHSEKWALEYFSIFWNNNLIMYFLNEHMGSLNYVMQLAQNGSCINF